MIKQVLRLTVVAWVWKKYSSLIISTLILFGFFWLVNLIHQDYLTYAEHQQLPVGSSFIIKWLALTLGSAVYFWKVRFKTVAAPEESEKPKKQQVRLPSGNDGSKKVNPDAFEELRYKSKLRSKADIIIDKSKE